MGTGVVYIGAEDWQCGPCHLLDCAGCGVSGVRGTFPGNAAAIRERSIVFWFGTLGVIWGRELIWTGLLGATFGVLDMIWVFENGVVFVSLGCTCNKFLQMVGTYSRTSTYSISTYSISTYSIFMYSPPMYSTST